MGGNAFSNTNVRRIKREEIYPTLGEIVNRLDFPNLDLDYVCSNLLGSAGKQDDSGDLDIALNSRPALFVGETELPVFSLKDLSERCLEVLPEELVDTKTIKSGQIQTAWPIAGDPSSLVQVDFVSGNVEWLKFTHYSPGKDKSEWKGAAISTMLAVLTKFRKDFEKFSDGSVFVGEQCKGTYHLKFHKKRVARVGLHYDLEKGLFRKWEMQERENQGMRKVDPDVFETNVPESPRFARINYVDNPDAVLEMIFGHKVSFDQIDTFEKLVAYVAETFPVEFNDIKDRFVQAYMKSGVRKDHTHEELYASNVWNV